MNSKRLAILTLLALSLLLFKVYDWKNSVKPKNIIPSSSAQSAPASEISKPITILMKPVLVRLQELDEEQYLINVDFKSDHFSFNSDGYGASLDEYLKIFGWKGSYLFVHRWNGCGSC